MKMRVPATKSKGLTIGMLFLNVSLIFVKFKRCQYSRYYLYLKKLDVFRLYISRYILFNRLLFIVNLLLRYRCELNFYCYEPIK